MANVAAGIMLPEWSVSAVFTALENHRETERCGLIKSRL